MSDSKRTTKIAAIIASIALIVSSAFCISNIYGTSHAEETPTDNPAIVAGDNARDGETDSGSDETGTTTEYKTKCPDCNTIKTLAALPEESTLVTCDNCSHEFNALENLVTEPEPEPEPDPILSHDEASALYLPQSPSVSISPNTSTIPGSTVSITMAINGPKDKANGDPLTVYQMTMPKVDGFEFTRCTVGLSGNMTPLYTYAIGSNGNVSVTGEENGSWNPSNNTFSFSQSYLASDGIYGDGTNNSVRWNMTYTYKLPSATDTAKLNELRSAGKITENNGNLQFNFGMISSSINASAEKYETGFAATTISGTPLQVEALLPHLRVLQQSVANKTTASMGSNANMYDVLTYSVQIKCDNTPANGIEITDVANVAGIATDLVAIDANSLALTLNSSGGSRSIALVSEGSGQNIWWLNGNFTIKIPDTLGIGNSDSLTLTYNVRAGNSDMTQATRNSLIQNQQSKGKSGERNVSASAANGLEGNKVTASTNSYNLLIPGVSKVDADSKISSNSIPVSGIATIEATFNNDGAAQSKIINPTFTFDALPANFGTIENFQVSTDGGSTWRAVSSGTKTAMIGNTFKVKYDYRAPNDYVSGINDGFTTKVTMSADNALNSASQTSPSIKTNIPKLSASVSVDNAAPSANNNSETGDPVKVTVKVNELDANASVSGIQLEITESASDSSKTPVSKRFESVMINDALASPSDVSISSDGNKMTVIRPTISAGGTLKIEYQDILKKGTDFNGLAETISATVSKAPSGSNLPPSAMSIDIKPATFTIQTPKLHIAKEVIEPLVEDVTEDGSESTTKTPAVINVGDTVKIKTTFSQSNDDAANARAIGRDFVLTEQIEDLFISNEKSSDARANAKAVSEGSSDGTAPVAATGTNGYTYKPSQLGISFGPVADIHVMRGDADVTDKYDISIDSVTATMTVKGKTQPETDLTKDNSPLSLVYSVKMGDKTDGKNYDQLSGKSIDVKSNLAISNLDTSVTALSTTKIADAEVHISKSANNKEARYGDAITYTVTVANDPDNKFDSSSAARKLVIEDNLDQNAINFGYRIDPSTLKVQLGNKDVTNTSDASVSWSDKNGGYVLALANDLKKRDELVISYDAVTTSIDPGAYSNTLSSVAIATADNSKPAAASVSVSYIGNDIPAEVLARAGSLDGDGLDADSAAVRSGEGKMGETGDVKPYVLVGVIALSVIIAGSVFVSSRRKKQ